MFGPSALIKSALAACCISLLALPACVARPEEDDGLDPAVSNQGNSAKGWSALPTVAGAAIDNTTIVVGQNATLLHYIDAEYDASRIKRVVIQVHGDSRDAWNQWLYADLAAKRAVQGGTVRREEVLVVAPQFFEVIDYGAYPVSVVPINATANVTSSATEPASTSSTRSRSMAAMRSVAAERTLQRRDASSAMTQHLRGRASRAAASAAPPSTVVVTDTDEYLTDSQAMIWDGTDWGEGSAALQPFGNGQVGAFDAFDSTLAYFLDRDRFPALNRVVLAGFSLGGQLVQRYAAFRHDTSQNDRITFWVSSPNSFVYFNETRPLKPKKACRNSFNDYKYGLAGTVPDYVATNPAGTNSDQVISRFLDRTMVYLCGVRDKVSGASDCPSNAQGSNHVSKMAYWTETVLPYLPGTARNGTLPPSSSVHWVSKTAHQDWKIITSDPGVYSLFLKRYNDDGSDAAAPPSNGVTETDSPRAENGALSSLAVPSRSVMLTLSGSACVLLVLSGIAL